MSASHGTGIPLTLRCSKCKVGRDWKHGQGRQGLNLEATGNARPLKHGEHGPLRIGDRMVEIRCRDCGHLMWSKHSQATRLLEAIQR